MSGDRGPAADDGGPRGRVRRPERPPRLTARAPDQQPRLLTAGAPDQQPRWPCRHSGGAGTFDETARRASHQELAVAMVLVSEGHDVRTVAERRSARTPDLLACGTSVEVKGFQNLSERGGRAPSPERVANKLLDARGQGSVAVIWGAGSGLTPVTARSGYDMFRERARQIGLGKMRAVRIMGDGFDVSFGMAPDVRLAKRPAGATAPRDRAARRSTETPARRPQPREATARGVARSARASPQLHL